MAEQTPSTCFTKLLSLSLFITIKHSTTTIIAKQAHMRDYKQLVCTCDDNQERCVDKGPVKQQLYFHTSLPFLTRVHDVHFAGCLFRSQETRNMSSINDMFIAKKMLLHYISLHTQHHWHRLKGSKRTRRVVVVVAPSEADKGGLTNWKIFSFMEN